MDRYMYNAVCKEQGHTYRISKEIDVDLWQFEYVSEIPYAGKCFMCGLNNKE